MKTWNSLKKWLLLPCFVVQLCIVGYVVWQYIDVKATGEAFLFQTAPKDPRDPFRGHYVALRFEAEGYYPVKSCADNDGRDYSYSDTTVYATLAHDDKGHARIIAIHEQKPAGSRYLAVNAGWCRNDSEHQGEVFISLPFDKYFANEYKALEMERQAHDKPEQTFLKVWVKDGRFAVEKLLLPR